MTAGVNCHNVFGVHFVPSIEGNVAPVPGTDGGASVLAKAAILLTMQTLEEGAALGGSSYPTNGSIC